MTSMLTPVVRTAHVTVAGSPDGHRKECWMAVTTDGRWRIERAGVYGNPWYVYEVCGGPAMFRFAGSFTTLRSARAAIAGGRCNAHAVAA